MNLVGWAEFLFIALLAFVIIGPKDLPKVLFMIGRFIQSMRRLSDQFMAEFETIHSITKDEEDKSASQKNKLN